MRIMIVALIFFFSTACFADETWSLKTLSIVLANDLKQTFKDESENVNMYIFASPFAQVKIVALNKAPQNQADVQAWQLDMLGKQIAFWQQSSKLPLDSQKEVLNNKPNTDKIGKYTYQTVDMSFPSQNVKFLNVVNNEVTYMFTLMSFDQDSKQRKEQMDKLVKELSSVELKPIKK
ncbi:MAG: hypothetical protein AB7I18_00945 [Candidatus Berkiella sp.]